MDQQGICAIKALRPPVGNEEGALRFRGPFSFSSGTRARVFLQQANRVTCEAHEVTIKTLGEAGATHFCWLGPREAVADDNGNAWPHGGFAYFYEDAHAQLDCVFSLEKVGKSDRKRNMYGDWESSQAKQPKLLP